MPAQPPSREPAPVTDRAAYQAWVKEHFSISVGTHELYMVEQAWAAAEQHTRAPYQARIVALEKALRGWDDHLAGCAIEPCICGLDEARAQLPEARALLKEVPDDKQA